MANAASIVLVEGAASTLSSPASGSGTMAMDTNNHPYTLNSGGSIYYPVVHAAITSDQSPAANTDTIIESLGIPAGLLAVAGTHIEIVGSGTYTAGAGATPIFTVRAGTGGTVSDSSICQFTAGTSATTGSNIVFFFKIEVTVRAVTAGSGTTSGICEIVDNGTTGIFTATTELVAATGSSLTLTTPTFVSLSFNSSSASNTAVFKTCDIRVFCP